MTLYDVNRWQDLYDKTVEKVKPWTILRKDYVFIPWYTGLKVVV